MTFEVFAQALVPVFEDAVLTPETPFRDLPSWSSLAGLSLMAVVSDEFDVLLSGNDIRSATTLGELFEIINKKL